MGALVFGLILGLAAVAKADNPNSWNLYTSGNSDGYHCDMGTPQQEGGTLFVDGPFDSRDECVAAIPTDGDDGSDDGGDDGGETTPPVVHPDCTGSVDLGPWYGDPRINIDLTGAGTFVVRGGVQRFSNTRVVRVTLGCRETFRVSRYKVRAGKSVRVYLDGVLVASARAPIGLQGVTLPPPGSKG
jgi:hypothetical protein